MEIKSHGAWQRYTHEKLPYGAPANAMFSRRAGDGIDWYDYVNAGKNFAEGTIKMTVVDGRVAAATSDPTMLFPAGATVLEVHDVAAADPQGLFGGRVYDGKTFRDPPPAPKAPDPLGDLLKRIEILESKQP